MVTRKTSISLGAMESIMLKETETVTKLFRICSRSVDNEVFTVSMS